MGAVRGSRVAVGPALSELPARLARLALLALLALVMAVTASGRAGAQVRTAQASPGPEGEDPIQQAAWLAGHWEGEGLGGWNEAFWSPPRGGTMMGVFRHYQGDEVVFYEILTLGPVEGRLVLTLRHFDADLTAWEERDRTVTFPLIRAEGDALHFDGMTYRRVGPDVREVTVMLGPSAEELRPEVFRYRRVEGPVGGS